MNRPTRTAAIYRTIWRWHFYAGLFVLPLVLILATTGAMYLFKPQIDRWEERAFRGPPATGVSSPSAQRDAALAAFPGSRFIHYRLPDRPGDAALIELELPDDSTRDVFVSPDGRIAGAIESDARISEVIKRIHGQLLIGYRGSWLVELAASWAIVLIASGLYLMWPRDGRLAGVIWPRLTRGGRALVRDLHAVTGFWVAGFAMILLLTGLPWAHVWGSAFKEIRAEMGWTKGSQDWTIGGIRAAGGEHASHRSSAQESMAHGENAMSEHANAGPGPLRHRHAGPGLDSFVARAAAERLAFPVLIAPPTNPNDPWIIRSESQNRPLRVTLRYASDDGHELERETFTDKHVIDRVVGYGVAWHEGQLFGAINQIVGALTALGLMILAITGFLGWRRRKPEGKLGAPAGSPILPMTVGLKLIIALCFILLPLFAVSLVALWAFDRIALPHLPGFANWLGVANKRAS